MKNAPKELKDVAARTSLRDHSKRPEVAEVRAVLQRLARQPQTAAAPAPAKGRTNKKR